MYGLRVGIIGAGIRGKLLGRAIRQNECVEVVGVAEISEELRSEANGIFDCRTYADYREMLDKEKSINAVLICTPDFAHLEPALEVANRGLDFLIEKPLATNSNDAEAIVGAASKSGARGVVAFENRWNPVFKRIKSDIESGDIGQVRYQNSSLNDTLFVPTQMLSWANKTSPGWFLMPHSLDISLWLAGRSPVEVFAFGSKGVCTAKGIDTFDAITALVKLDDGTHLTLDSNWILPAGMPQVFDFNHRVVGSDGAYEVSISESGIKKHKEKYSNIGVAHREEGGRIYGMIDDMMRDFALHLRHEKEDLPDLKRGALISRTIEAIHKSLGTSSKVEV